MALFVIIARENANKVQSKIDADFSDSNYKYKDDTWIVEAPLTTNEIADKLGIRVGTGASSGLAISISGYAGRATSDLWEWLSPRFAKAVP